ncbi:MAG: hypothetical protein IKK99_03765 [Oscillospiraceae bacterium]|nr:hypothetical protein [Oscillospiraceae bacterium]
MNKTWGEIRKEALHLGFDREANYVKYKDSFVKAFNWAQNHVASVTGCLTDVKEIVLDADSVVVDMGLTEDFLFMANRGVEEKGVVGRMDAYSLTDNRYLRINGKKGRTYCIYYAKAPKAITDSTADSYECEIPYKWAKLIPYYMANRLYLEDDTQKAGYYWNLAEDMKNDMLIKEREPEVTVFGGFDVDGWCI